MFVKKETPSSPLFYSLNILKIEDLCKFEIAKFIFKIKNIPDFNYMHNLKPINQIHKYNTRLSKNNYFLLGCTIINVLFLKLNILQI